MLPGNDESADIQITIHKDGTESLRVEYTYARLHFWKVRDGYFF